MRLPKFFDRFEEPEGWGPTQGPTASQRAANGANSLVNWAVAVLVALALLFSGFALFDALGVLFGANQAQAKLMEYKPGQDDLAEKFAELQKINPDVCAWVEVDNTNISYPVCQGEKDFMYLDTDVYGKYSPAGSIFITAASDRNFTDSYTILYGHNMQEGVMFGDINKFLDEAFFSENVTARIYLPDRILELETVAICEADAYDQRLFTAPSFDMTKTVNRIYETALHQRGERLSAQEQVIALSTCGSGETNQRHLLMLRVVGEKLAASSDGS